MRFKGRHAGVEGETPHAVEKKKPPNDLPRLCVMSCTSVAALLRSHVTEAGAHSQVACC